MFLHITRSIIVFFTLLTSLAGYAAPVSIQSLWDGEFSRIQNESEPFYRLITSTNDNPSFVVVNYAGDVDLTGHFIQFQIRVNSYENWGGIELRLSSDNDFNNYYSIQVPYFSDPDFNIIQPNVWSNYTLSLGEAQVIGQPDKSKIKKIGFYVQGRYIDGTSFNVDLKNFEIKKSLSKAIISMTFDDGYEEQYRAAEIMNRFGLRGTAYLMSNEINQPSYMTTDQLISLKDDFGWGLSSHHKTPITDMTLQEYNDESLKTIAFLNSIGVIDSAPHYAYPLGKQSRLNTLAKTGELFLTARVAGGGAETLPPSDWLMLKTFNVTPDVTAEDLSRRIDLAIENQEWLILMFHMFTDEATSSDPLVYTFSEFEKLCDVIRTKDIPVHPVNEVYEAFQ